MAVFNIEGYNSYSGCDITVTASLPVVNGKTSGKYYTLGSIQTLSISTHQDKRPVRSLGVINAKDYVMGPRTIAGSMVFAVFNKHFATEIMNDLGASGSDVILPDEIPALDITINFANEYGRMSRMAIYGVKIINEGQVMSINDLYTENTYQFVALGLEPLSAEDLESGSNGDWYTSNSKSPSGSNLAITPSDNGNDQVKAREFEDNSGTNVSNQIKNNNKLVVDNIIPSDANLDSLSTIELFVDTTDAISEFDLGLATFTLKPIQISGNIFIYEGMEKKSSSDFTLSVSSNTIHNMFLPIGIYTAQFIDSSNASNIINFTIGVKEKTDYEKNENSYPIVEKVTHDSIVVKNEDRRYNTVNIFKTGGEISTYNIGKNPITITNLEPDSEYNIFASNSLSDKSNILTTKTFQFENQDLDFLKKYVATNNALFINQDTIKQIEEINMKDYDTLLDAVLTLPESVENEELLIYASLLTNQLIDSYNSSNPNHISHNIQEHPFSNTITLNEYKKMAVYSSNNKKRSLNKVIDTSKDSFFGTPNRHYYVCGIDENNISTVKKDFVILQNSYIEDLNRYTDTEKYKELSLTYYTDLYKKYSGRTIQTIAIMDNHYSDLNLLEPPYIYKNENNKIYADVKYNFITSNETYYLVCANLYDVLDFVPFRKIPFTLDDSIINLDDYYLGLNNNNYYLFWIENESQMIISKSFVYRNYDIINKKDELDDHYKNKTYSKINKIQSDLCRIYPISNNVIKEIFNYIYDLEPSEKSFNDLLIAEFIERYHNSIYSNNLLDVLFELLNIIHQKNKIDITFGMTIDTTNKCIKFDKVKDFYICAINYTEDGPCRILDSENIIYYNNEGYLMIYLMSDTMIYKSGFILIDCKTNKYKSSEELINCIREGVVF